MRNAPVLNYWRPLNVNVNKISFERNDLYINKQIYNENGIGWYSKVHTSDTVYNLEDIKPPFELKKRPNSDTLRIIKEDKEFYLLISERKK